MEEAQPTTEPSVPMQPAPDAPAQSVIEPAPEADVAAQPAAEPSPPDQPLCSGCCNLAGGSCRFLLNALLGDPQAVVSACSAYDPIPSDASEDATKE